MATKQNTLVHPSGWTCKYLAPHHAPHFDEFLAMWMIQSFGESRYPGAKIALHLQTWFGKTWDAGIKRPDPMGRSAEELEREEGIVSFGCGGGRFDEHPDPTEKTHRKVGCAATLVARDLGLEDHPHLISLIRYAEEEDRYAGKGADHMPMLIKMMHQQGHPYDVVCQWAYAGINAKYFDLCHGNLLGCAADGFAIDALASAMTRQYSSRPEKSTEWLDFAKGVVAEQKRRFREVTPIEYQAKARVKEFSWGGTTLKIVSGKTDDDQFSAYARSKDGCHAAVVVVENVRGQVSILLNKYYVKKCGLRLDAVARSLRLNEWKASGKRMTKHIEEGELRLEGKLDLDDRWHWFPNLGILNGSFTAPGVPPTRLSLDRIVEIIYSPFDRGGKK